MTYVGPVFYPSIRDVFVLSIQTKGQSWFHKANGPMHLSAKLKTNGSNAPDKNKVSRKNQKVPSNELLAS